MSPLALGARIAVRRLFHGLAVAHQMVKVQLGGSHIDPVDIQGTEGSKDCSFHLLKNMVYLYLSLLVLKGIYHYWTYVFLQKANGGSGTPTLRTPS